MNDEQLISRIIKLNAEIDSLQHVRDGLKAQLCAVHNPGDKMQHGDTQVSFSVRRTVNAQAVEQLKAFKALPKTVREKCYTSKIDTKRVAALGVDLSPATKTSDVYVTFR